MKADEYCVFVFVFGLWTLVRDLGPPAPNFSPGSRSTLASTSADGFVELNLVLVELTRV